MCIYRHTKYSFRTRPKIIKTETKNRNGINVWIKCVLRLPKGHQYSYLIFFFSLVLSLFVRNSIFYIFLFPHTFHISSNCCSSHCCGYVIEMRFCIKFIGQWLHLNRWWHCSLSVLFVIPAEKCDCIYRATYKRYAIRKDGLNIDFYRGYSFACVSN